MMPLCISHPTAASPGRNNKVRVFIRSGALYQRTQFVLKASTADGRWRHAPKTAVSTRIARIARHPLTVPRIPPNPYLRPIKNIVRQMKGVPLPFPYLPQLIQLAVLTSVLALFGVLFITIGVVTQAAGVFRGLILDTQKHLREGSTVERSAQAISVGIYSLLFLPFWMIQLPFSLVGSIWSSRRLSALLTVALLLSIAYVATLYSHHLIRFWHSF